MTKLPALTRTRVVRAALRLFAAVWIATDAGTALPQPTPTLAGERTSPAPVVAVFTGRFDGGAPVYRLPSLTVTATGNLATVNAVAPRRQPVEARASRSRDARTPS